MAEPINGRQRRKKNWNTPCCIRTILKAPSIRNKKVWLTAALQKWKKIRFSLRLYQMAGEEGGYRRRRGKEEATTDEGNDGFNKKIYGCQLL